MIMFFSGTGNSEFVARRIAERINDDCMDLFNRIRNQDHSALTSDKPFVIVCPTYGWRIPRILHEWLQATSLNGNKKVYFVLTCGYGIGNAGAYVDKLCLDMKMEYMGCAEIIMPENYVAMFPVPDEKKAIAIVKAAVPVIDRTAGIIADERHFPQKKIGLHDRFISSVSNSLHYPLLVHTKKFRAGGSCIGCGVCTKVCPLGNISLKDAKPTWGNNCTHCMACICKCPQGTIEYGIKSKLNPKYLCPKI